jgi:hypothetical protein
MLNELFFLQLLNLIVLIFFINALNILTLWYLAGIYLISLGIFLLVDDGDIFVGFLWVIDLGVGLIFFIFILHFSNFLHQKTLFDLSNRFVLFFFFIALFFFGFMYFIANPTEETLNYQLKQSWFLFISWYNYYSLFNSYIITDLNLLRELYFYNNSYEFFIINFMLFYGIFGSINLCFLIKKIFIFLNLSQFKNLNLLGEISSTLFIRNQNFFKQQNASTGSRVWLKKKQKIRNDL